LHGLLRGKDEPVRRTELIRLGSEVVIGAGLGIVIYLKGNKSERLPAGVRVLVGVGVALVLDLVAAGIVAITNCDPQDSACKK
jgi:hypothetical protein